MDSTAKLSRFGELTPLQRYILKLYGQGYSFRQIAEIRGVSQDSIQHTVFRARIRVGARNSRNLIFLYGAWIALRLAKERPDAVTTKALAPSEDANVPSV